MTLSLREQMDVVRQHVLADLSHARRSDCGTGSRWELQGYLDILDEAIVRLTRHRHHAERVDQQIARQRWMSARTEGR